MTVAELAQAMPGVARHFWGEPNPRHSSKKELRWGTNGARSVDVPKGTWFDHEAGEGGGVIDFLKRVGVREIPQWLKQHGFSDTDDDRPKRFKIVATYDYTDESGTLLFQVCRLEPKSFRQRRRARPDDPPNKVKDGWVWNVKGVRQVPFRLPELIERWRWNIGCLWSRARRTFSRSPATASRRPAMQVVHTSGTRPLPST
jgi:hypothetical protein